MKIRYGKTYNLGNYESHHIEVEISNVDKDKAEIVFAWLVQKVESLHKSTKVAKQIDQELPDRMDPSWTTPEP
jgi:hypothetical protein